jgi:Cache 3/Cache 2 fusion domain
MFATFPIRKTALATRKGLLVGILAVGCFVATSMLVPSTASAQADPRVAKSMETLKAMTAKLGAPKVEGNDPVGGKDAPGLYFGTTKVSNNFDIVDAVAREDGQGMTATLFVKSGDEFIRASTNVKKDDGSRAMGTALDLKAAAGMAIVQDKAYYGPVAILGKSYITGYEPMKDGSGKIIGVYYVGYPQ